MSASNGWSSVRTESGEKLDAFRQRFLAGSNTTTTTLPGQSVPEDGRASLTNIATAAQAPKAEATPSTPPKQAQAETGSAKKKRSSPTGSEGAKKRTKADSPVGGSTGKTSGGNSNSKKAGGSDNSLSEDKLQPGNGIAMTDHVHMAICIAVEPDFGNGTEVCLSCGGFVVDIENGVFCSHCGECYHGACIYPGTRSLPKKKKFFFPLKHFARVQVDSARLTGPWVAMHELHPVRKLPLAPARGQVARLRPLRQGLPHDVS